MARLFQIIILLLTISCQQQSQTSIPDGNTYGVDTLPNGKKLLDTYDSFRVLHYKAVVGSDTLKGGGITCYGIDDSMRYFYFRNGDELHLLNQSTKYQSPWSLGTLEKDFDDFFLTTLDHGNGTPQTYQVFEKKSGHNILGDKVEAISHAYLQDTLFMLYDNWTKERGADSITLFNVITKRKETYELPNDLPDPCDIQIENLTKQQMTIWFFGFLGEKFEKTKIYDR